jgi:hypothetical protein
MLVDFSKLYTAHLIPLGGRTSMNGRVQTCSSDRLAWHQYFEWYDKGTTGDDPDEVPGLEEEDLK